MDIFSRRKLYNLIFIFTLVVGVCGAEPVSLRGFITKDLEGHWVLLDKPNVKSCCVGKESARIRVEGEIPEGISNSIAVLVEGDLHESRLTNARIVPQEPPQWIWIGSVGAGVLLFALYRALNRKGFNTKKLRGFFNDQMI